GAAGRDRGRIGLRVRDRQAAARRPHGLRAARRRRVPSRGDRGAAPGDDGNDQGAAPSRADDAAPASGRLRGRDVTDRWTDRRSGCADGSVDPGEAMGLEAHLAECEECAAALAALRRVAARAAALGPLEPARDLWPAIAARLAPRREPWSLVAALRALGERR